MLGAVVEVVSGKKLDVFIKERITGPLGMKDTAFHVEKQADFKRVAELFKDDGGLGGGVEFFDPRVANKWKSGGGGMVGTAADYARFLQMLLNGGTHFWVDPKQDMFVVFMMQSPKRRVCYRAKLRDIVYGALAK